MRGHFQPPIPGRVRPLHFKSTKSLLRASSPFPTSSQDHSLTEEGKFASNKSVPTVRCHLFKSQPHLDDQGLICLSPPFKFGSKSSAPKMCTIWFHCRNRHRPDFCHFSQSFKPIFFSWLCLKLLLVQRCSRGGSNLPQFHP